MDPYAMESRNPHRRGARVNPLGALLSLALGLCLSALSMGYAVGVHATDLSSFQAAADAALVQTGILSQADAERFAQETIGYLTGRRAGWLSAVTIDGQAAAVPAEFAVHMAQVQKWVKAFRYAVPLMIAAFAFLVFLTLIGAAVLKTRTFAPRSYLLGAAIPVLLLGGAFLWAALDFAGFWEMLHNLLIPGGIFAADAAVMRLFPLTLFERYTAPVALTFLYCLGIVLLVPVVLVILDKRVRRRRYARQAAPYEPMEYR